jgi:class IV lanthipeptide synthase
VDRQRYRVQAQCHGAIGIGRFLLRLSTEDGDAFAEAAAGAAVTAQREGPRRPSPSLCHGVAGDGLFFLEVASVLEPEPYLELARQTTTVLDRHRRPDRPGSYTQFGSALDRPELLVGDAGVGWFYLALAQSLGSLGSLGDPVLGPPPRRR